ncbi:MAG: hypothetical protein JXA11_16145 [Phycisphaerae bacterium]|nr:hypothetical protein [Phycisphaerae bacterium]
MRDVTYFIYRGGEKTYLPREDFELTVLPKSDDTHFASLAYRGEDSVEVHFGAEIPLTGGEDAYTLLPGVYYNGNNTEPTKPIPAMCEAQGRRFEASLSACSTPILAHYDGKEHMDVIRGTPFTKAGPSGVVIERDHCEFVVPAVEKKHYTLTGWDDWSRPGFVMRRGSEISFTLQRTREKADSVIDMFHLLHRKYRDVEGYSNVSEGKTSLESAAQAVAEYMLTRHCLRDAKGNLVMINVSEVEGNPHRNQQITGWCGGTMTAYALLGRDETCRAVTLENIDFLTSTALSVSGLAHGHYDGNTWSSENSSSGEAPNTWKHIRPPADFVYFLLKALQYERNEKQTDHPEWEHAARSGIDAFCTIWEKYGEFGFRVDKDINPPKRMEKGSCAGAFALQALTEGMRVFPEEKRYRKVFRNACDYYHQHFVRKGHCTGGPLDIERADDSESAAAMTNAFTQGYLILKDDALLRMARDAAAIFASWVVSYVAPFPRGSSLDGYNLCGGVIANVQNRHIGPGICTNSPRFLRELYDATGEEFYCRLHDDIVSAAINCVAMSDDEFVGYSRGTGQWTPFQKGMVTEQINLTDALNEPGEMWQVACSWPATFVLLADAEKKGR